MQDVEEEIYLGTAGYNLTEEVKEKIKERYGLSEPESPKETLFQGDFGFSFTINFPILISSVILLVVAGVLLYFILRKRKSEV